MENKNKVSEETKSNSNIIVVDDKISKTSLNEKQDLNVCVLGVTGTGKSATCNTLCNDYKKNTFPEFEGIESGTKQISKQVVHTKCK